MIGGMIGGMLGATLGMQLGSMLPMGNMQIPLLNMPIGVTLGAGAGYLMGSSMGDGMLGM